MADDGSAESAAWPLPKFYFEVKWDARVMHFQEVSGLDTETQVIDYRHGGSKMFSTVKMPGMRRSGNVTMKRGVFVKDDDKFWDWYAKTRMNTISRMPVTISLIDESGAPTMVWTLANAWPTKITAADLESDGNDPAIETIEFIHEGLTIANG